MTADAEEIVDEDDSETLVEVDTLAAGTVVVSRAVLR